MEISIQRDSYKSENIIFFDGICNYCLFWVRFLLRRDRQKCLKFSSMQSQFGSSFLSPMKNHPDSIIYWRKGVWLYRSQAVLAILSDLGGLWSLCSFFKIVPCFVLDKVYDLIAWKRYSLFGQRPTCYLPSEDNKSQFLES